MPTYVLRCESCARFGSFLIHEGELPEDWKKQPIQRHCPTCHKTTNWAIAIPERREGHDRRSGVDRRAAEKEPRH
jgi:hypothetical protein